MEHRGEGMEQEISLYIPTGVKAQNELFNGFGKREFLQSMVGSLLGGSIAVLTWMICGIDCCDDFNKHLWECDDVYERPK